MLLVWVRQLVTWECVAGQWKRRDEGSGLTLSALSVAVDAEDAVDGVRVLLGLLLLSTDYD